MREHVIETVTRWKDHPATRMWGLGNEVLLETPIEQHRPWATLFIQMADLVHELDPTHPVIYRESEDLYVARLMMLFGARGIDRPWLHYGMNIYTMRIDTILEGWPKAGFNKPLFINEFGPPFDQDYPNRAQNYLTMWNSIRAHKHIVFGAAPYTWMAPGPDPYDGFYGFVGAETARPVDDTWGVLTNAFRRARLEDQPAR
jgi:beta-galactosidase/beta-glucuronidase